MNSSSLAELEQRAGAIGDLDVIKRLDAQKHVRAVMESMEAEQTIVRLTDEEMKMIESFRRFRAGMKKSHAVFTWATHIENKVELVRETALVEPVQQLP